MNPFTHRSRTVAVFLLTVVGLSLNTVFAASDAWTNSLSGFWRVGSPNWSLGIPPGSADSAFLTNAGTKTVTVDAATPAANLTVINLTLSAPLGTTNTLFLTNISAGQPLAINNQFTIRRGGALHLTNSTLRLPVPTGSFNNEGGSITLDGGSIDFSAANLMRVGRYSTNQAGLTVKNGTVNGTQLQVGQDQGLGTLSLSNGLVTLSSFLSLGVSSTGNPASGGTGTVVIANGELRVTNGVTEVGYQGVGQVIQSGGTSRLAYLSMGNVVGTKGTFAISGGQLIVKPRNINDLARIGNAGFGQMDISGGVVSIMAEFILGDSLATPDGIDLGTGVVSVTGGQLTATNDLTSIGKYGTGQMTISNATVTLTNVSVGRHDNAVGTLTIQSNAALYCLDTLSIGRLSENIGAPSTGHVYLTGGLLSLTNDAIWVGRGGSGGMTVSNGTVLASSLFVGMSSIDPQTLATNRPSGLLTLAGGTTTLSSNLVVGSSQLSTGQVVMAGGTLLLINSGGNAHLKIDQGSFTLARGNIVADNFYLTNASGQLAFNGGTLQAGNITASNGSPFVVGNGVNPATLQLQGGTFTFANGLRISPNATVTGCGTIIGNITNNGTLATNCAGLTAITVTAVKATQTNMTAFFTTTNGQSYTLQYSAGLPAAVWISIPPTRFGNGSVMSVVDTTTPGTGRFYRIHSP